MEYQFEVRHTPGHRNVVADWLSRAIEANAVEEEQEPSTSLRQFFQEWRDDGEGDNTTPEPDRSRMERESIEEIDEVINDKKAQIRWKSKTTGLDRCDFRNEGRRRVVEVETTGGVTKPRISRLLKGMLKEGRTQYIYVGNESIWKKISELYRDGEVGSGCTLIRCTRLAQTVVDETRQRELTTEYHLGKTNHRGIAEMLAALKRRYFWDGMAATVERVVKACVVCARAKADTRPPRTTQELTPTAHRPLQLVEIDTFTWRGYSWITVVDTFSKIAMAERVAQRPADAVIATLRKWCQCYGVPEKITSDGGTEFRNEAVEEEGRRLEIQWHVNTPGYTQGRGCVERLHGTLSDHMRLLMADQGLELPEVMERAIIAYNHSVHSATGYTPVELVFGGAFGRRDCEQTAGTGQTAGDMQVHVGQLKKGWRKARERLIEEKARRVLRHNVRVTDASDRVNLGSIVYRRIATNRRKEPERYAGPYRVVAVLEHNRYYIEPVENPGRRRQVHLQQLKIMEPVRE